MEKILIVDDDSKDLKLIASILKKEGYSVVTTTKGTLALDKIENVNFDLVLLDILMPVMTGYDLFSMIRETKEKKIKLAFLSIVSKKQVKMKGIDGFIQKPFSEKSLLSGVKKILNKK